MYPRKKQGQTLSVCLMWGMDVFIMDWMTGAIKRLFNSQTNEKLLKADIRLLWMNKKPWDSYRCNNELGVKDGLKGRRVLEGIPWGRLITRLDLLLYILSHRSPTGIHTDAWCGVRHTDTMWWCWATSFWLGERLNIHLSDTNVHCS